MRADPMSKTSQHQSLLQRLNLTGQRGEHLVVIQFILIVLFAILPAWHPGVDNALLASLRPWLLVLVIPAGLTAILFAGFGSLHIREYLTPLPYPVDHNQLVCHGVYALVRHPLYASQLFAAAAWALYNLSLSHLLILILGFVFFDYKASQEEAWLSERHPAYRDYAARVRKFIPWIY
jgi:protein-S-isoprenylcysteine O-methyltransferase Ste14